MGEFKIAPIKLKLGLIIIKDNNLYDVFILLKEILGLLPSQLFLFLEKLTSRGFIDYDLDRGRIELTDDGLSYLKGYNLHKVTLEELMNESANFNEDILLHYIPSDI